jgi:membrane associated rhomboid family serine protease
MSVTLILVLATVGASFYALNNHIIYEKWMMIPYRVKQHNEYHRFITSGFIHSGYMHLGFNMLGLYAFAPIVENELGPLYFVAMYLTGIIISDIPTYLKQKNNYAYRSLGASGGVAAIIFSSILIYPLNPIGLIYLPKEFWPSGFIFGIIYLIYSYYQAKNSRDNIGHEAHFYGAVYGIIFSIVIKPQLLADFFYQISEWTMF